MAGRRALCLPWSPSLHTRHVTVFAALAAAVLLAGCNNQRAETAAAIEAANEEGISKTCVASAVDPAAGASASATMTVGADGGWCALRVAERDGQAFATGLVRVRPAHGRIDIEKAGSRTLVKYFPAPGYTGPDTFTAALRSRTPNAPDLVVKVAVTVTRQT